MDFGPKQSGWLINQLGVNQFYSVQALNRGQYPYKFIVFVYRRQSFEAEGKINFSPAYRHIVVLLHWSEYYECPSPDFSNAATTTTKRMNDSEEVGGGSAAGASAASATTTTTTATTTTTTTTAGASSSTLLPYAEEVRELQCFYSLVVLCVCVSGPLGPSLVHVSVCLSVSPTTASSTLELLVQSTD